MAIPPSVWAVVDAPSVPSASKAPEIGMPVAETFPLKDISDFGQAWTILQGPNGVIYVGVGGGQVLVYDGVSWRRIDTGMDVVRSLALGESGRIWLGGDGGFWYIQPAHYATSRC
jgi:hypothetical protein